MGEKRNPERILAGKPEGKRQLGRRRHRREYNMSSRAGFIWLRRGTDGGLL
jgi:hypothetical protein